MENIFTITKGTFYRSECHNEDYIDEFVTSLIKKFKQHYDEFQRILVDYGFEKHKSFEEQYNNLENIIKENLLNYTNESFYVLKIGLFEIEVYN